MVYKTELKLSSLQSDARNARPQLEVIKANTGSYPADASSITKSPGTTYEYTSINNGTDFCIAATSPSPDIGSFFNTSTGLSGPGPCPAGYWAFNGDASDSTPYGNDGTVSGATLTTDRKGSTNAAYAFNGTAPNFINLPASGPYVNVGTTNFTVSAWLKTSESTTQRGIMSTTGSSQGFRFGYSSGKPYYLIGSGTNYLENAIGSKTLNDNTWHLLTIVYAYGTNWTVTSYIDGQQTGSVSIPSSVTSASSYQGTIGTLSGVTSGAVTGSLDDIKFYNIALTPGEIQQIYDATK